MHLPDIPGETGRGFAAAAVGAAALLQRLCGMHLRFVVFLDVTNAGMGAQRLPGDAFVQVAAEHRRPAHALGGSDAFFGKIGVAGAAIVLLAEDDQMPDCVLGRLGGRAATEELPKLRHLMFLP
ncbi:hypothetical protein PA598K_00958 [Paenibacillus sp. 598K]|nr:hypothetical protein PA598K_00958 [Paenibacillus sp. 598K]